MGTEEPVSGMGLQIAGSVGLDQDGVIRAVVKGCLLYTSDAADE